ANAMRKARFSGFIKKLYPSSRLRFWEHCGTINLIQKRQVADMDRIEWKICEIIDRNQEKIKEFGRDIWTHAELGYRETRTAERFAGWLSELGIETEKGLAVTGVKGYLSGKGAKGLTVALMGE